LLWHGKQTHAFV